MAAPVSRLPDPLDLPPAFVRRNAADPDWLRGLPDLIDRLEQRYTVEEFAALSANAMGQAIVELGATCPDAPRR